MFNNIKVNCNYKYSKLYKDSSGLNFKSIYTNIIILLHNSNYIPTKITINNNEFDVMFNNYTYKRNVLCITTVKNFVSYNLLIKSLQIYHFYGVSDVYLYLSDAKIKLDKISILPVNFHVIFIHNEFYMANTFYFGQIIKHNDCLYRNMYNSNYIIFADFDEVILLHNFKSYYKLLYSFPIGDIFYFKSALCPTTQAIENKKFHLLNDTSLAKTLNCCLLSNYYHRKYIIKNPFKFIKINIHYVDYAYKESNSIYINDSVGYIHHSRIPTVLLLNNCNRWFFDTTLFELFSHI